MGAMSALPVRADRLTDVPAVPEPAMDSSAKAHMYAGLDLLSDELNLHLTTLTGDMVDIKFDARGKNAKLRLGGGDAETFQLSLNGDVVFHGSVARVDAKLDVSFLGEQLSLELPDFEVVPRTLDGRHYVEVRVPVLEGSF